MLAHRHRFRSLTIRALNKAVPASTKALTAFCKRNRREIPYILLVFFFWLGLSVIIQDAQAATPLPLATQTSILEASSDLVEESSDPTPSTINQPTIEQRIRIAARAANVNEDRAVAIARCESSLNPQATNWQGSTAKGLFQFTDPTWKYIKAQGHQFDVDENIRQFMIHYPKRPHWWACDSLIGK